MEQEPKIPDVFDIEKSPIKEVYILLDAKCPKDLHDKYVKVEQILFKSHEWDYDNAHQIQNKVKNILESLGEEGLTEDEKEWRDEILWFWYHHAISCSDWKRDKEKMKEYSAKALEYQDNPNILTRTMYLLSHDKIDLAQDWVKSQDGDLDVGTAEEMINNYKTLGWLWPHE